MVQAWARTPLWKRAEYLHKVDGLMKDNAQPMADALLNEVYTCTPGPTQYPCNHRSHAGSVPLLTVQSTCRLPRAPRTA